MSTLFQSNVIDAIRSVGKDRTSYIYAEYDSIGSSPGLHNISILGEVISDVPSLATSSLNMSTQRLIGARIQSNSSQSISNNTVTTLTFNDVIYDTDNMADLPNNRLTIQTPGLYDLKVFVRIAVGSGFRVQSRIEVNGEEVVLSDLTSTLGTCGYISSTTMFLEIGDDVTGHIFQVSGSSQSTSAALGAPALIASLISTDFIDPVPTGTTLLCLNSKTTPLTIIDRLSGKTVEESS